MKKPIILFLVAAVAASLGAAPLQVVKQYMVCSKHVPQVATTDSVDALGKKIDRSIVLKSFVNTALADEVHTIVATDSLLPISRPTQAHSITLAGFNLYSDLYTDAIIGINTQAPAEIYIDNTLVKSKTGQERSVTLPLSIEPMRLYHLCVKMLTSASDTALETTLATTISKDTEKATLHFSTDEKTFYQLTDNFMGTHVTSVSISPCGKYLLTSYYTRTDTKHMERYTILTDTKSGAPLAPRFTEPISWMPRSSKLYYTVATDYGFDLMTIDPASMATNCIAHNIPENEFIFSPTEDYLVFTIKESALKSEGSLIRHASQYDRVNGRGRSHIAIYSLSDHTTRRLTAGNHSAYLHDISPDGRRLLFATYTTDYSHRQQTYIDLYQLDHTTMDIDTLLSHQWFFGTAQYSPDGTQLVITAGPEAFDGIGLNCGEHKIANDYDSQAYLFDIASRQVKAISRHFDPSLSLIEWNANGNIYFAAQERDVENIYEYNPIRNIFTRLDTETEMTRKPSFTHDAQIMAYLGVGLNHSTRAYLYDMRRGRSTLVADPMAPVYANIELGSVEDFEFDYQGTDIDGFLCYPPQFDASKRYPMIVYYYGGTSPSQRWNEYYYGPHLFASRGYVVYVLNPSGTTGYGQEFSARHVNAWGQRTADEIIYGTRLVCREHDFIDSTSIGCIGASYGGFMTQYLQTRTDLFACAVSHAGISNVTSYWGEGFWGVGYNTVAAAESYPWTNPELFTRQGSLFNADKINTPILLLHGNADTNVPIGESIQLYNALKIQNKEVEFIEVDGENHTIVRDLDKQILWHATTMAWFARWLQDAPEWWDKLYPTVMTE